MSHIRHFEVGCEIAKMFLTKYAFVEQITKSGIYGELFFRIILTNVEQIIIMKTEICCKIRIILV